jgi:peptidoglycan/xylan/chitin deacetylase (PgdA/CDA1 family)
LRAVLLIVRPGGRRVPSAVPAGVAHTLVLFTAIVCAVTLSGAGLGLAAAGARAPSPRPPSRAAVVEPFVAALNPAPQPAASNMPAAMPSQPAPANADAAVAVVAAASPAPACFPEIAAGCGSGQPPAPIESSVDPSSTLKLHVPIFEYHRIKPPAGETGYVRDLIVPPPLFAAQMQAMATAGWHTMTMRELGEDLRLGVQPSPKSFVVTFDDGYEDGYTYAFPILAQHGFVATYFVIGSRIGNPGQLTVGEMQDLVAAGNEIGNHTLDHRDLNPMTPEKIVTEIYTTEALIATAVGVWPESFCYPMGLTNASVTSVVAATPGLMTAVIQTGSMPETWANRLSLPRIRVGPGSYPQYLVDRADRYIQ